MGNGAYSNFIPRCYKRAHFDKGGSYPAGRSAHEISCVGWPGGYSPPSRIITLSRSAWCRGKLLFLRANLSSSSTNAWIAAPHGCRGCRASYSPRYRQITIPSHVVSPLKWHPVALSDVLGLHRSLYPHPHSHRSAKYGYRPWLKVWSKSYVRSHCATSPNSRSSR